MALRYQFTQGIPTDLSENDVFIVGTLLMATCVDSVTPETIPVIMKRYAVAEVLQDGKLGNAEIYRTLLEKCMGMTANVTNKTFRQFMKGKLDWASDLEIPKARKA